MARLISNTQLKLLDTIAMWHREKSRFPGKRKMHRRYAAAIEVAHAILRGDPEVSKAYTEHSEIMREITGHSGLDN